MKNPDKPLSSPKRPDPKDLDYQDLIKTVCGEKEIYEVYALLNYLKIKTFSNKYRDISNEYFTTVVVILEDLGYKIRPGQGQKSRSWPEVQVMARND